MGIYIKGMEMPESCEECALMLELGRVVECGCSPESCPLVPVKTPHGRLIDADALVNTVVFHTNIPADIKEFIEDLIGIAPTVIGAEVKDER